MTSIVYLPCKLVLLHIINYLRDWYFFFITCPSCSLQTSSFFILLCSPNHLSNVLQADERFHDDRNTTYISKWLRKSIKQYDSFAMSLERLQSFFIDAKVIFLSFFFSEFILSIFYCCIDEHWPSRLWPWYFLQEQVGKKALNVLQSAETNVEKIHFIDHVNGSARKKNQLLKKSDLSAQNEVSNCARVTKKTPQTRQTHSPTTDCHTFFHQQGSQGNTKSQKCALNGECGFCSCKEYVDLECSPQKDSRWSNCFSSRFYKLT